MTDLHQGLEERRAREAQHIESTLRAMATNYAGGHRWDFLDGQAVTIAADEITRLRAIAPMLSAAPSPPVAEKPGAGVPGAGAGCSFCGGFGGFGGFGAVHVGSPEACIRSTCYWSITKDDVVLALPAGGEKSTQSTPAEGAPPLKLVAWRTRYRSPFAVSDWKLSDSPIRPDLPDPFDGTRGHEVEPLFGFKLTISPQATEADPTAQSAPT